MMETVLNVGLNDESVHRLAAQAGDERFAWDSYRRLIQMFGKTVLDIDGDLFEDAIEEAKRARGSDNDADLVADDFKGLVDRFKAILRRAGRTGLPDRPARADGPRRQSGVRLVERRPGDPVPAAGAHPRRPRYRRQHLLDGLRQHGPGLRDGRRVHPRPRVRPAGHLRRLPAERAGRGRRRRDPQHGAADRAGAHRQGVLRPASRNHGDAGEPLPRHVRHRVHDRAREAVDAADPE